MSYQGDFRLGDTFDFHFTTRNFSTGSPFTLGGTPVISAYPSNSVTQLTAGITLNVDFDSVTGLNHVRVVASSGNGYATATDYSLVITAGTVNGVSVVGETIGNFSIEHRSAVIPTVAARTLDVSSNGNAGIDWSNIDAPTTSQDLSGTTVKGIDGVTFPSSVGDATAANQTIINNNVSTRAAPSDIVTGGAINTSGGIASADIKKVNGAAVSGDGQPGDEWGPA